MFFVKNRLSGLDSHIHSDPDNISCDRINGKGDEFEYSPIPAIHCDIEINPTFRMNPISARMNEEITEKRIKAPSFLTSNQNQSWAIIPVQMNADLLFQT